MVVVFKLSPSRPLMKSANVSPTVVHRTLMIQKNAVTRGTLLSARALMSARAAYCCWVTGGSFSVEGLGRIRHWCKNGVSLDSSFRKPLAPGFAPSGYRGDSVD